MHTHGYTRAHTHVHTYTHTHTCTHTHTHVHTHTLTHAHTHVHTQLNLPQSLSWLSEVGLMVPILDMANHAGRDTASAAFTIDYTGKHLRKEVGECAGRLPAGTALCMAHMSDVMIL